MKEKLFTLGPVPVYGYGLMIAIGIFAAYLTAEYRAKKLKLDFEQIFPLAIWCVIGGLLGAKLLFFITELKSIIENPRRLLDISQGFVVYGGIIGGILTGYLFCKKKKLNFLQYFDLVMPSIALAQGFGRIGCLLTGCCYGVETDSPLGIVFHESSYAPNGIPLVPTQTISSILNFFHFFLLLFISRRTKADGQIAGFYLIFYSIGRFILEFYRGDLERGSVGRFSTSQFISIFIFLAGIFVVFFMGRKGSIKAETKGKEE